MASWRKEPAPVESPLGLLRYTSGTWEGFKDLNGDEMQLLIGGDASSPSQAAIDLINSSWLQIPEYAACAVGAVEELAADFHLSSISADDDRTLTLVFSESAEHGYTYFVDFADGRVQKCDRVH